MYGTADTGWDYFGRSPSAEMLTDAIDVPGVPNDHPMGWRAGGNDVPTQVALVALLAVGVIVAVQAAGFRTTITIGG